MRTIVYRYGCLRPSAEDEAVIVDQLRGAHEFKLALTEAKLLGQREWKALMSSDAETAQLEAECAELEAEIERLNTSLRETRAEKTRASGRKHGPSTDDPGVKAQIADAKERRKNLWGRLKERRKEWRESPETKTAERALHEADLERDRSIRAQYSERVTWQTRGLREAAVKSAVSAAMASGEEMRLRRRFTGEGVLGGQTTSRLFEIAPVDPRAWDPATPRGDRRRFQRTTVRFRAASRGGEGVWVTLPMVQHRPLPEGAEIVAAKLVRRRHATWWRYEIQLTLRMPELSSDAPVAPGVVGIDLGWRTFADGVRAAYWWGSDGQHGEIVVPRRVQESLDKAESIRSVRDVNLSALKAELRAVLDQTWEAAGCAEQRQWMSNWRAPRKFAALRERWRRLSPSTVPTALDAWYHRDRHLWQYETGLRTAALLHRDEVFAVEVARLAERYGAVGLEAEEDHGKLMDLTRLATQERAPAAGVRQRTGMSRLRDLVTRKWGQRVVAVAAAHTTANHACGGKFVTGPSLILTCEQCGSRRDQDANAAKNICARAEVLLDQAVSLAQAKAADKQAKGEARREKMVAARRAKSGARKASPAPA